MIRFFLPVLFLCVATVASAVTDDFVVSQVVGADSTPPTTPTGVVAAPIAPTQIDVSWSTSTDDQNLTGYRLFRDAVQIATTSLVYYSDTGLTPSTTYAYTVEAYDWFLNISTTSAAAVTTTPAIPVIPVATSSPSSVGSQLSPRLISLQIDPQTESAQFSWDTNIYTKYILRWGETNTYDSGSIQNTVYSRSHTTNIRGLEEETKYLYELIGVNQLGREFLLTRNSFTTIAKEDIVAPANVTNVRTIVENDSVYIQWVNPVDDDFAKVRVMRNHLFYPSSPVDGFIVYEGSAQSLFDAGVLSEYQNQFYTIFAYDEAGNVSSGAITAASRLGGGTSANVDTGNTTGSGEATQQETTQQSEGDAITFADIRFIQDGALLKQLDTQVVVDSELPLRIEMPAKLLATNLKTIVVTLTDRNGDDQSYILRSNSEKTMYEAFLRSLPEGLYGVSFSIYDYYTELRTTFDGQIDSQKFTSSNDDQSISSTTTVKDTVYTLWSEYIVVGVSLLILFLILWWLLLLRRSREDN